MPDNRRRPDLTAAGRHVVQVRRGENTAVAEAQRILEQAQDDLLAALRKRDPMAVSTGRQHARVRSLVREADEILTDAYRQVNEAMKASLVEFGRFGREAAQEGIGAVARMEGIELATVRLPSMATIRALATSDPVEGRAMYEWWQVQKTSVRQKFRGVLRNGVVRGQSIRDMATALSGTRGADGKYHGGVLPVSRFQAESLIRTAVTDVSVKASLETYRENSDIISGWEFVATLDERTTEICANLDGNTYPLEDQKYAPPQHYQCRSTVIPRTGILRDDRQRYPEWFREQDRETQDRILGPGRAELVRSGQATFSDLVRNDGSRVPLNELRMAG